MDIAREALEAENRISEYIRETPLEYSVALSKIGNCNVYLKLENYQVSGSFKFRGAANHILSLSQEEKEKGIITASTGNHGSAVACILKMLNIKGTVYIPENTSMAKLEALKSYGIEIEIYGADCLVAENHARNIAEQNKQVYIPPYNHPKIIGGQATIAIELKKQLAKIDAVLVPVGGGGLISGIAGYLKDKNKAVSIIGCQPENSPVMYKSVKQGKIVDMESKPTLSDGTAGGIEKNAITFDICRDYIDKFILVSENEIKKSIDLLIGKHNMIVEGAGALSVAAFAKTPNHYRNKNVILIVSGNKLSRDTLKSIL